MLVMIDPGHGGADPGGHPREKEANLDAALDLAEVLQAFGATPTLTRWRDGTIPLAARSGLANRLGPDCFVSLHHNAFLDPAVRGFEVWTSPGQTPADPLAARILDQVARELPELPQRRERGPTGPDKEARFHVLTATRCPAVLVELEFLTHPEARRWVLAEANRRRLVTAIARALVAWGEESAA